MALTFVSPAGHETGGERNADLDDAQTALYGVPCSAALSEILSYHCNKYYVTNDFRFILNSAQSPFNHHKTKASNRISRALLILVQIFSYAALKGP
jgi:hypothetical protein